MTGRDRHARVLAYEMAKLDRPHSCRLDCPYCGLHVVDLYGHLMYRPCQGARAVRDDS